MAGTSDDGSTLPVFRLLCDEYAFVLRLVGSSNRFAYRLIERFLQGGERDRDGRVRYKLYEVTALPGGLTPSPYDGDFWCSYPERGIRCAIEPWNCFAHWTGPGSAAWKEFDGRDSADYQVVGIKLNHDIFLEFLGSAGLYERTQSDESETGSTQPLSSESPLPSPPPPPAETASTVPAASQSETLRSQSESVQKPPEERIATFLAWARDQYHHRVPKRKFKWIEAVAYPRMRNELGDIAPWDSAKSLKRAMYPSKDGK